MSLDFQFQKSIIFLPNKLKEVSDANVERIKCSKEPGRTDGFP